MLRRDPMALAAWLVVFAWLVGSAAAFWYFEMSDWRPFSHPHSRSAPTVNTALVEEWFRGAVGLRSPTTTASLTFVHLYNPACRCNRFTETHLQRLIKSFDGQGVRFMSASPAGVGKGPTRLGLQTIASAGMLHAAGIDSAPSALIFDGGGRLIYYGPYSNSAWCGSEGALVDPVLKRALTGAGRFSGVPAVRGCYCEW